MICLSPSVQINRNLDVYIVSLNEMEFRPKIDSFLYTVKMFFDITDSILPAQ
jgi:hypothetical protein